jgi:hypothetical protein
MKNSLLVFLTLIFLCGCKKDSSEKVPEKYIRFTYNGQQYEASEPGSFVQTNLIFPELIFANFYGLVISRPEIFGGDIIITAPNTSFTTCAYLRPAGTNVAGSCSSLLDNGNPIDSVRTYWMESGSISSGYSECKDLTGLSVPGQKLCTVNGSFSFTLTNKNNQKIIITNGTFKGQIKKYN